MTRRLPGKKWRSELFHVDGLPIHVEVRIDDDGTFFAWPDTTRRFSAATLAELRAQLRPYLEEIHKLTFDPFINVEYNEPDETSRYDNLRDREGRQEVLLEFNAGWLSRGADGDKKRRWIAAAVVHETCEIEPPSDWDRKHGYSDRTTKDLIAFTPDRWRRLRAINEALADLRRKISEVLSDTTGARLEAMTLPRLLEAAPAEAVPVTPTTKKARQS